MELRGLISGSLQLEHQVLEGTKQASYLYSYKTFQSKLYKIKDCILSVL